MEEVSYPKGFPSEVERTSFELAECLKENRDKRCDIHGGLICGGLYRISQAIAV